MKLMFKKFAFLGFISLFLLGIVGCNPTTEATATDLEKVQAVLASIDLGNLSAVSADLTLPAPTTDGVTVTWTSSNLDVVSNTGAVTIPGFTAGEQTVTLTVTATLNDASETKTFTVTVPTEAATAFFTRAGATIIIDGSDQITSDFLLPSMAQGATVTYESSNTDVVSISATANGDGFYEVTVNRPSADDGGVNTSVTITATLTFGTATGTVTKSVRVMAEESSAKVTTIADGMALGTGEYVTYQGMTIVGVGTDGFFFTDGTKIMFVYAPMLVDSLVAGDVYDVTGSLAFYYFGPQLAAVGTNVVKVAPSTAAVSTFTPVPATVSQALAANPVPTTNENPMVYTIYELTAKVYVGEDLNDGYDVFLVPADYDTSVTLDLTVTDAIRVYYKSDIDVVRALAGQVVTLDLLLYNYHTGYGDWYSYFFGTADDIQVTFASDQDAVDAALAALQIPTEVLEATTIDFPASLFGVTLTYASDNETVINPTTGVVDLTGLTAQATVTITVTASRGTVTGDTQTFVVKVGETPLTDIATAIANVNGTVRFQGIVTELNGNNAYVQDETGATYLYLGSNTAFADILVVGNMVEVEGKMVNYHNLLEVSPVSNVTLISTGNTLPTPAEFTTADNAGLLLNISKLVNVSGLVVKSIPTVGTSSYTIYLTDGTNDVQLRVDKYGLEFAAINALVANLVVGQPVSFSGIVVGVYDANPQLMWLEASELTTVAITDQNKLDFDAFKVPATLELEGNYTFPTFTYAALTVKEVSTELTSYVTDGTTELVVVAPEGADVTGTVTFTLTLGELTQDFVVATTVKAITDAQKLAFDLAALTVDATANEYDTITLPVLGAKGSTIAWVVNTGSATLTGADLALNFVGSAYDVTLTATLTIGSETAVTKDFTIAVSPVTIVTDLSTIPAMTDGVKLYVQGTVAAIGSSYDGTWIQDSAGNGFFLYKYFGSAVGDEVLVYGTLGSYHSAKQMVATAELKQTVSTGATPVFQALTADQIVALTGDNGGTAVTFTGLTIYSLTSSTAVFKVAGTSADVYLKTYISDFVPWVYNLYQVGDTLPAATFVIYNVETSLVEGATQFKVGAFHLEVTDAQMVEAAIAAQSFATEINADTTLTLPTTVFGVAITWASDNETVINSTTGVVDITNLVETTSVTLTGTFVLNAVTVTHDFVISCEFVEQVNVDWTGATVETFDNFPSSTSSYVAGTFTGVSDIVWTYTKSRGDASADTINGAGVMFGDTTGSMVATVANGVGSLKVDVRSAFTSTTPRVVELFINDVSFGTYTLAALDTTYTFIVADINVSGSVTIRIQNAGGGKQTVIDNLTWTAYNPV